MENGLTLWIVMTECHLEFFSLTNGKTLVGLSKLMAAEYSGMMLSKSERTIRQWRADFAENGYEVPGRYQQSGVLWLSEELNKRASDYMRENANG